MPIVAVGRVIYAISSYRRRAAAAAFLGACRGPPEQARHCELVRSVDLLFGQWWRAAARRFRAAENLFPLAHLGLALDDEAFELLGVERPELPDLRRAGKFPFCRERLDSARRDAEQTRDLAGAQPCGDGCFGKSSNHGTQVARAAERSNVRRKRSDVSGTLCPSKIGG